jgi:hypothetical protein
LKPTIAPPVSLRGNRHREVQVLREFAEFWKIPYHEGPSQEGEEILVSSSSLSATEANSPAGIVVFPSGLEESKKIAQEKGLALRTKEILLRLPVAPDVSVSIRTRVNEFSGPGIEPIIGDSETPVLYKFSGTRVHLSSVDVVSDYERLVAGGFEEVPSRKFRLVTKIPFSYRAIPSFIRNRAFRAPNSVTELTEDKLAPVECLRVIFLASLVVAAERAVPRIGFWRKGKSYALAITHDVETKLGLEDGAGRLADIESKLGVRSTWNVPSERYPLSSQLLISLATAGEVGGHDTKHDGRLIFEDFENKVERVGRCKSRLESLSRKEVRGFRAPLLQHGRELTDALGRAGFQYDSSAPSWERLSPTSLKPHGVGTVFPFFISGMLEIPVSLPQDHQLIRVSGLTVSEAVEELFRVAGWVRGVGGACVLLVHPDYEFGQPENSEEYYRLLERFKSDPECEILTLGELAQWWTHRANSQIETGNGDISIRYGEKDWSGDLELELVTGYSGDGFKIVRIEDKMEITSLQRDASKEEKLS